MYFFRLLFSAISKLKNFIFLSRLFDEIRWTSKVSMFPVGLVGKQGISAPVVRGGRVVGFTDPWIHKRKFPVDMAGFAFNVKLLVETK